MNTLLWWVIGIVGVLLALGVLVPELVGRSERRRNRKLSHRPKRRIEL